MNPKKHTNEMTHQVLCLGGLFACIDFDLPGDASPQLLGDARDWCLNLIEALDAYRNTDVEPPPDDTDAVRLIDQNADTMQRAKLRLDMIDAALRALGYNPPDCGYGKMPSH